MIHQLLAATAAIAVATASTSAAAAPKKAAAMASAALPASSPFSKPSSLPFGTPDFSKIKDSDYLPALLAGMAQQKARDDRDRQRSARPTFDNTIVALERSGQMLERANHAFNAVNSANTNDTLQATDTETAPLFAAHNDFIFLNPKLFARVQYLNDHAAQLNLDAEQAAARRLLQAIRPCRRAAVAGRTGRAQALNKQLSTLQTAFSQKLLAAAKAGALHVTTGPQAGRPDRRRRSTLPRRPQGAAGSTASGSSRCRTRRSSRCCRR